MNAAFLLIHAVAVTFLQTSLFGNHPTCFLHLLRKQTFVTGFYWPDVHRAVLKITQNIVAT